MRLANRKASIFEFAELTGSPEHGRNLKRRNKRADPRNEIDPLPRSIGGGSAEPVDLSKGTSAAPSEERWPDPPPTPGHPQAACWGGRSGAQPRYERT